MNDVYIMCIYLYFHIYGIYTHTFHMCVHIHMEYMRKKGKTESMESRGAGAKGAGCVTKKAGRLQGNCFGDTAALARLNENKAQVSKMETAGLQANQIQFSGSGFILVGEWPNTRWPATLCVLLLLRFGCMSRT